MKVNKINEMNECMEFNENKMELMNNELIKLRREVDDLNIERNNSKWMEDDERDEIKPESNTTINQNYQPKNKIKKKELKPAVIMDEDGNLDKDATRVEAQPIDWTEVIFPKRRWEKRPEVRLCKPTSRNRIHEQPSSR